MNPSYFRIDISLDEMGQWKKGACLFTYEKDGWTIFEDLKGSYSDFEGEDWFPFAMNN
ncbi:MAG: hypothetical protein ACI4L2_07185 [Wujia sp.]